MTARRTLQIGLAVRAAYGVGALFLPDKLTQAVQVAPLDDDARYLNALFGGRDLTVVGVCAALLRAGRERDALLVAASCELTDTIGLLLELKRRGGVDSTTGVGIAFNAGGWAGVIDAARRMGR
jgi:hypothetical protein